MQLKIPEPRWRKLSREISNTKGHPKIPFRLANPIVLYSNCISDGYGGWIEDKNDAITDTDVQNGCVNGN